MRLLHPPGLFLKTLARPLSLSPCSWSTPSPQLSSLRVCVLGVPNAGKSSLINALTGSKGCPYSSRTHTTRLSQQSVYTRDFTQLVLIDTPGVVKAEEARRFRLEDAMVAGPAEGCEEADLLLVCQDVSNRFVREAIDKRILKLLARNAHKSSILVLTKIDQMPSDRDILGLVHKLTLGCVHGSVTSRFVKETRKKVDDVHQYLDGLEQGPKKGAGRKKRPQMSDVDPLGLLAKLRGRQLTELELEQSFQGIVGWPGFDEVLTVSASERFGVEDLRESLLSRAVPVEKWEYGPKTKITQSPKMLVLRTIQAKMLEVLPHILPYKISLSIHDWQVDATPKTSHKAQVPTTDEAALRLVINLKTDHTMVSSNLLRDQAENLKRVKKLVEEDLQDFFVCPVFVRFVLDEKITSEAKKKIVRRYKNYAEEKALLLGKIEK